MSLIVTRLPRGVVVFAAFAVAILAAGGAALALEAYDPTAGPAVRHYACVSVISGDGQRDDDYCDRLVADRSRRPELSGEHRARLAGSQEAIRKAIRNYRLCGTVDENDPACLRRAAHNRIVQASSRATPEADEVKLVHSALLAANFTGAVVRPSTGKDPAPRNTVFYAVPVLGACILGHVQRDGLSTNQDVVAELPNGRCI